MTIQEFASQAHCVIMRRVDKEDGESSYYIDHYAEQSIRKLLREKEHPEVLRIAKYILADISCAPTHYLKEDIFSVTIPAMTCDSELKVLLKWVSGCNTSAYVDYYLCGHSPKTLKEALVGGQKNYITNLAWELIEGIDEQLKEVSNARS